MTNIIRIALVAFSLTVGAAELAPRAHAMGLGDGAMCDGFMDCIYTAAWYAFRR